MAAYALYTSGFDNVGVLKGGFNDWMKSGRCKSWAMWFAIAPAAPAYWHVLRCGCGYVHQVHAADAS